MSLPEENRSSVTRTDVFFRESKSLSLASYKKQEILSHYHLVEKCNEQHGNKKHQFSTCTHTLRYTFSLFHSFSNFNRWNNLGKERKDNPTTA